MICHCLCPSFSACRVPRRSFVFCVPCVDSCCFCVGCRLWQQPSPRQPGHKGPTAQQQHAHAAAEHAAEQHDAPAAAAPSAAPAVHHPARGKLRFCCATRVPACALGTRRRAFLPTTSIHAALNSAPLPGCLILHDLPDLRLPWRWCSIPPLQLARNVVRSALTGAAVLLDYCLMLVVVTFNLGLILSATLGFCLGALAFGEQMGLGQGAAVG